MALDILRVLACAWVLLFHWSVVFDLADKVPTWLDTFFRAGYLGVDLFFLLSGAVIAHSAMGRPWQGFAKARFLRLFPVFFATAMVLLIWLLVIRGEALGMTSLLALTGLNFWLDTGFLVGPSWTLPLEIQFYVLVTIAIIAAKNQLTERRILGGIYLYFLVYLFTLTMGDSDFLSVVRLNGLGPLFMLGALLGISRTRQDLQRNGPAIFIAVALTANAELSRTNELGVTGVTQILWVLGVMTVGCGFILWSSLRRERVPRYPAIGAALVTLSLMTYPLYLLHHEFGTYVITFLIDHGAQSLLAAVVGFVLVVGLSYLSVRVYEPWARRMLRRVFGWDPPNPTETPEPSPHVSSGR